MFKCERDGNNFGLRCEDHADGWLAYVRRNEDTSAYARITAVEDNGWCVDCAGDISGDIHIIDVDHAMDVFWDLNWERFGHDAPAMAVWRVSPEFIREFNNWVREDETQERFTFEFDVNALPVLEITAGEVALIRSVLFDYSMACSMAGKPFPFDLDVLNGLITKLGTVK